MQKLFEFSKIVTKRIGVSTFEITLSKTLSYLITTNMDQLKFILSRKLQQKHKLRFYKITSCKKL